MGGVLSLEAEYLISLSVSDALVSRVTQNYRLLRKRWASHCGHSDDVVVMSFLLLLLKLVDSALEKALRGVPPCINSTAQMNWLNRGDVRKALHIPDTLPPWDICRWVGWQPFRKREAGDGPVRSDPLGPRVVLAFRWNSGGQGMFL